MGQGVIVNGEAGFTGLAGVAAGEQIGIYRNLQD